MFKKSILYILVCLISLNFSVVSVFGYDRQFYSQNGIYFFDPDATPCVDDSGGASSTLVGNDNTEKILRYFVDKGLSLEQASGIAGNFWQESAHNPSAIQNESTPADDNYVLVEGVGFGIAQWTTVGRQAGLTALSQSDNKPITDLQLQLKYTWQELGSGSYSDALDSLKQATTPEDAAFVFHRDFEKSADTESAVRLGRGVKALEFFNQYSSLIAGGGSSSGTCNGNGTPSQFIDGFAVYNQYDPQWKDKAYGISTIGSAGCGPSAMAAIITAFTGVTITPVEAATYGAANGTQVPNGVNGAGSSYWNIAQVLANWKGLTSKQIYNNPNLTPNPSVDTNIADINQYLRDGGLILASGRGAVPYTEGGHLIVIRAVTSSNTWLVADSNGIDGLARSSQEWNPQQIMDGTRGLWLITK